VNVINRDQYIMMTSLDIFRFLARLISTTNNSHHGMIFLAFLRIESRLRVTCYIMQSSKVTDAATQELFLSQSRIVTLQSSPFLRDCAAAQRAIVESVEIGRATLEQTQVQGEQLDRVDAIADETQFKLDKAARMLRGMTWSGWMANMFTSDVVTPTTDNDNSRQTRQSPPFLYENVPVQCKQSVHAIQNYHANLKVYEESYVRADSTREQLETLDSICDSMYEAARKETEQLTQEAYRVELQIDLKQLRERQLKHLPLPHQATKTLTTYTGSSSISLHAKNALFTQGDFSTQPLSPQLSQQDEHLEFLARNLSELGDTARNMNASVAQQNETMDRLDAKTNQLQDTSKLVTRRADRLVTAKRWTMPRAIFMQNFTIRHVATGKYLGVVKGDVFLMPRFTTEHCVFGKYARTIESSLFGLKLNGGNSNWMGQNWLGTVSCVATSFGKNQEWEVDDERQLRCCRMLCASANWGAGGWLMVRERDNAVQIGSAGVAEKQKAAVWCFEEYVEESQR
jgi:hypothetical protein